MKFSKFVLIICFFTMSKVMISQSYINHMGNCDSNDVRLHYENFAFLSGNQLDTLEYTHVLSFYCGTNVQDLMDDNIQKQFFTPFHYIQYNSVNYLLSTMRIHLIYHKRDSLNASNEFLIELKLPGTNNPLSIIYGSDYVTDNPEGFRVTLAYLVSLDLNDPYVSGYSPSELSYSNVFDQNGSYLYEIHDTDRSNKLVGFKYYSQSTQTEYIRFFLPNN